MAKRNVMKLKAKPVTYTVIGISSHENDYRVSWSFNEHLDMNFTQTDSLITDTGNEFTRFKHDDEHYTFNLISNRCDNAFLLDRYKNFDFILTISDELTDEGINTWLRQLKKVPLISAVFLIPCNKQIILKLE